MTARATTDASSSVPRPGLSVRARIAGSVALLVTLALAGAGLIVYFIEWERIETSVEREVEQELDEFRALQEEGVDPETGEPFDVRSLLQRFLQRNVPDDDELLVGWANDGPAYYYPREDEDLVEDPAFQAAAAPLVTDGGTTRLDSGQGELRITSQPVRQGNQTGALLVVAKLDEDRAELAATMRTYTIVALLSLFIVTSAAYWQAGRLLRPLRTLRATADEIGETDLSRRVPETGNDDLTALTRTVNGMLDRLEAAFQGQRHFLDDAGHELKTPLTVLRGHLELLDSGTPAEVVETRALLLDEVDRMSRLVEDLILLAKSSRPDFLSLAEARPATLADRVLAKARALGDRDWTLDTPGVDPDPVVVDDHRLTQAMLSLADNAVKHTDPGQQIGIGAAVSGSTLLLWVRDTGRGVDPADRERIFHRFGRAYVPSGDEGFGLGLSIVSAIAEAHGGSAYVEDSPAGTGARFVVALPAVRRAPAPAPDETITQEVPTRWPGS